MYLQGLFERRLGGRGFGLHELAVIVAIAELSVHQEAQRQLNNTFKVSMLNPCTPSNSKLGCAQFFVLVPLSPLHRGLQKQLWGVGFDSLLGPLVSRVL